MAFLKDLQFLNPEARPLIIWDGASYHKYKEMKAYLEPTFRRCARKIQYF